MTETISAAPTHRRERITNLDTVRGIATLGILVMNAVSFGLPGPAYLAQTVFGLLVLDGLFEFGSLTRWQILVFMIAVWALQLAWSEPWLRRFQIGPIEWLWRVVTYRKLQPIGRS